MVTQRGQAQTEYAIILVGIAVISILVIVQFGGKIATLLGFAHDEVATLGNADLDWGDGADSGSNSGSDSGPDSGSDSDGSSDSGSSSSSSSTRSSSSRSSRGAGGGSGGGSGSAGAGSSGGANVTRPSDKPQRGTYQMGEGDEAVTVHAANDGSSRGKGSTADRRESEARTAAEARRADEKRWQKKRRQVDGGDSPEGGAGGGGGMLGFFRFAMLGLLLVGALFVGRTLLAGRGGGGEE